MKRFLKWCCNQIVLAFERMYEPIVYKTDDGREVVILPWAEMGGNLPIVITKPE